MANIFTVIGLGAFGRAAALQLQQLGNHVIGVDINPKMVDEVKDDLSHVVIADGTNRELLSEINVLQCKGVLVSIGDSLEASLLCVSMLKSLGVGNIWAKANTTAHHAILSDMGVRHIVHPETSMGKRVAQKMNFPLVKDMIRLSDEHLVTVLDISTNTSMALHEWASSHDTVDILAVYRHGQLTIPSDNEHLVVGDRIVVCSTGTSLSDLMKKIGLK